MEKLFKLKENGTAVKTEVVAGVTTFLAMAYILAVNPSMLGAAGMDSSAVFAATAVSAAFATLFMAFFANYPVALASGMGLNAYFAYTVVPQLASQGITNPWQVAQPTETSGDGTDTANKTIRKGKKVGRNDPCPCGSGKKYKKCCGKDE